MPASLQPTKASSTTHTSCRPHRSCFRTFCPHSELRNQNQATGMGCSRGGFTITSPIYSVQKRRTGRLPGPVTVMAIDAAQPFDFEARAKARIKSESISESRLKIGIVGFGTFGQFLAKRMVARGHQVIATSRSPYDEVARKLGVEFHNDLDDFCEEHPEVVLLASSILSTKEMLATIPVQRLKRNTLFVDVLSVKVFPKQLMTRELPNEIDVLCTHPMFGPDSGKGSWAGLNFMYEKVRVNHGVQRERRVENFLKFFRDEGCNMVEMTCEEHDRQAASTQFITHTVGRVLGAMQLAPAKINTRGYEALLNLVNNTNNDSFELYYGLFLYNRNATDELDRLEHALDTVKKQLFGRLHDIARQQLFPEPVEPNISSPSTSRTTSPPNSPARPSSPHSIAGASVSNSNEGSNGGSMQHDAATSTSTRNGNNQQGAPASARVTARASAAAARSARRLQGRQLSGACLVPTKVVSCNAAAILKSPHAFTTRGLTSSAASRAT